MFTAPQSQPRGLQTSERTTSIGRTAAQLSLGPWAPLFSGSRFRPFPSRRRNQRKKRRLVHLLESNLQTRRHKSRRKAKARKARRKPQSPRKQRRKSPRKRRR